MSVRVKINRKNLRRSCHVAGFAGVSDLSRKLGISRQAAYEAVTWPDKYPTAYPRIIKALHGKS